jgi:hypothetical protein
MRSDPENEGRPAVLARRVAGRIAILATNLGSANAKRRASK